MLLYFLEKGEGITEALIRLGDALQGAFISILNEQGRTKDF